MKWVMLLFLGWRRAPQRYATKFAEYIAVTLEETSLMSKPNLPSPCLTALSQLAYQRATKGSSAQPRFIYFIRELDRIVAQIENAVRGDPVRDSAVLSLLDEHSVVLSPLR